MDFAGYFFWGVLGALVLASLVLRRLDTDRMTVRIPDRWSAAKATGMEIVHAVQRGNVEVTIWADSHYGDQFEQPTVTVNADSPACGDCMKCVNEAVRWIQHQDSSRRGVPVGASHEIHSRTWSRTAASLPYPLPAGDFFPIPQHPAGGFTHLSRPFRGPSQDTTGTEYALQPNRVTAAALMGHADQGAVTGTHLG